MTDKFQKEATKFFNWSKENNCVIEGHKWESSLLEGFEEPSRNKLEGFLKFLMKGNSVSINGEPIDDPKMLAKMFREAKTKTIKTPKKLKKEQKSVIVDETLDTSDAGFLEYLGCSTAMLIRKLGEPLRTGEEGDKHRWEWKLKYGNSIFTVYDWVKEDGTFEEFDEITWCLGWCNNERDGVCVARFLNKQEPEVINSEARFEDDESEVISIVDEREILENFGLDEDVEELEFE